MKRLRKNTVIIYLILIMAPLFVLTACEPQPEEPEITVEGEEETVGEMEPEMMTPTEEPTPTPQPTPTPEQEAGGETEEATQESAQAQQGNTVEVALQSFEIDMPDTVPAGMTTFVVSNPSDMPHNFAIEGLGIAQRLDQHLQPGESTTLQIDLLPGEYRVWCPVGNHAERGMEMTLTVNEGS